jgi:hypothetical protein
VVPAPNANRRGSFSLESAVGQRTLHSLSVWQLRVCCCDCLRKSQQHLVLQQTTRAVHTTLHCACCCCHGVAEFKKDPGATLHLWSSDDPWTTVTAHSNPDGTYSGTFSLKTGGFSGARPWGVPAGTACRLSMRTVSEPTAHGVAKSRQHVHSSCSSRLGYWQPLLHAIVPGYQHVQLPPAKLYMLLLVLLL